MTTLIRRSSGFSPPATLRPARWYDAYPNLKMGIHLLYLAPVVTHSLLGEQLLTLVFSYLQLSPEEGLGLTQQAVLAPPKRVRWYDEVPLLPVALELLKQLPPRGIRHISKLWHQQFGEALAS
jgi:hypothetical protein